MAERVTTVTPIIGVDIEGTVDAGDMNRSGHRNNTVVWATDGEAYKFNGTTGQWDAVEFGGDGGGGD